MARDSAIPTESLEEILAWLDPDREVAAAMYVQLRHNLTQTFIWRQCSDPEGMTDEVFDRVARKVREVRPTYEGDPRRYFHAVARNLIKEYLKKIKAQVSLEDVDLATQLMAETEEETVDIEECLQSCLQEMSADKRDLIVEYHAKEKQAKIDHRRELAQRLGVSVEALRVRAYRNTTSLKQCIERCLKGKGQQR